MGLFSSVLGSVVNTVLSPITSILGMGSPEHPNLANYPMPKPPEDPEEVSVPYELEGLLSGEPRGTALMRNKRRKAHRIARTSILGEKNNPGGEQEPTPISPHEMPPGAFPQGPHGLLAGAGHNLIQAIWSKQNVKPKKS